MSEDRNETEWLEAHFAAARRIDVPPGDDLMARVLADALAAQAAQQRVPAAPRPARPGALAGLFRALGGWPAMAGLTAVAVAGVVIGMNPPDTVATALTSVLGGGEIDYLIDLEPGAIFDLAEDAL